MHIIYICYVLIIFHILYFDPDSYINWKIVHQQYLRVKLAEAIKGNPVFLEAENQFMPSNKRN